MRATIRMLASVKPERFLETGNPTGLTGLFTHPAPRSTLLYLYTATLEKLKTIPEHSVYRQSAEALTQHRFNIVDSIKPPGYDEWTKRAEEKFRKNQHLLSDRSRGPHHLEIRGESVYVATERSDETDQRELEWDGEKPIRRRSDSSAGIGKQNIQQLPSHSNRDAIDWESEPPLEASQIVEIENRIGGGLIEEVIQVAEGELKLADTMIESKVWEDLEERAPQGQWEYFSRDQHAPGTQEPSN